MPPAMPGFGVAAKEAGRIWTEIERLKAAASASSEQRHWRRPNSVSGLAASKARPCAVHKACPVSDSAIGANALCLPPRPAIFVGRRFSPDRWTKEKSSGNLYSLTNPWNREMSIIYVGCVGVIALAILGFWGAVEDIARETRRRRGGEQHHR